MIWILSLLLSSPLFAQFPLHLDLSGDWRGIHGDNPQYAAPDYDDSAWAEAPLPRRSVPAFGTSWLRRRIDIPAAAGTQDLVLTLGTVAEVYELYVNGRLAGRRGERRLSQTFTAYPQSFRLPQGVIQPGQPATIAIRLWKPVYTGPRYREMRAIPDNGPYLLTGATNTPQDVAAADRNARERSALSSLLLGEFNLVLLLILLFFWLIERDRHEIPYLVGFLAADAALLISNYASLIRNGPFMDQVTSGALLSLSTALLVLFSMELSGARLRWLRWVAWCAPLLHLAMNWIVWRSDSDYTKLGEVQWVRGALLVFLSLLAIVQLLRRLWIAWREPDRLEQTVLLLSTVAIVFISGQRFSPFPTMPLPQWEREGIVISSYTLASVSAALALTILLLGRVSSDRRERIRLANEMRAAQMVQAAVLSTEDVPVAGFAVDPVILPASEVGGDFYQILPDEDGSLLVLVGDVSGKGLRAALLVGHICGAVSGQAGKRPADLLAHLNASVTGKTSGGFVTCCCALLKPDGSATLASAGHLAPYLDGDEIEVPPGLPLGVAPQASYRETSLHLEPGQAFLFLSDGVVEAANASGELFGFERTRQISGKSAQEIADAARAWGQNDDITVVTVVRRVTV